MKSSIISVFLFLLVACGSNSSTSSDPNGSGNPNDNDGNSNNGVTRTLATIEHNGDIVAYILNFGPATVGVYIPSVDRYANYIRLADGTYTGSYFYWSGPNCTGTPITNGFNGEVGKTVLYDDLYSNYYLVSSLISVGTVNNYQSVSYMAGCTNGASSVTSYGTLANVTLTTRPYNFSTIAPLTPKFQ